MFAFLCMDVFAREHPDGRFIILVPTITLLDRWYVSLQEDFGVVQKDIACFSSEEKPEKPAVINLLVINSGRSLVKKISAGAKNCHTRALLLSRSPFSSLQGVDARIPSQRERDGALQAS